MLSQEKLKFGVFLPTFGWETTYELNLETALTAEKLGYDSAWVCDHLFGVYSLIKKPEGRYPDVLECWTILSALAAQIPRIRFGTCVLAVPYRNPALSAKMVATLDVITRGRLIFGIGTGRSKEEFLGYGIPFEDFDVRLERTMEALEIMNRLWLEPVVTYKGKFFELVNCELSPKPVQKPHPPVWIGGTGPKMLTMLELADGWLPPPLVPEQIQERVAIVEKASSKRSKPIEIGLECYTNIADKRELALTSSHDSIKEYMGRPPEDVIEHGVPIRLSGRGKAVKFTAVIGDPDECIEVLEKYIAVGVSHFILHFFPNTSAPEGLKRYAEKVIPYLKEVHHSRR